MKSTKFLTFIITFLLCVCILTTQIFAAFDPSATISKSAELLNSYQPTANDGLLIACLRMTGQLQPLDKKSVEYIYAVQENLDKKTFVSDSEAILGLTAAGISADVLNDGIFLTSLAKELSSTTSPTRLSLGLIALRSGEYNLPANGVQPNQVLERLMSLQNEDGGFGNDAISNVNDTGYALAALSFYREYPTATDRVYNAATYLVNNLNENGSFPSDKGETVHSTALAILGLSLNGFDASQLMVESPNCIAYLANAQSYDGGFPPFVGGGADKSISIISTIALQSYTVCSTSVFDFSSNLSTQMPEKIEPTPQPEEPEVLPQTEQPENPEIEEQDQPFLFDLKVILLIFVLFALIGAGIPIFIIILSKKLRKNKRRRR